METGKYYGYINGSVEIAIPRECVMQCAHSGRCDEDVAEWLQTDEIKSQFKNVSKETMQLHMYEWGCHSRSEIKSMSRYELSMYILWDLCATILDEINNK